MLILNQGLLSLMEKSKDPIEPIRKSFINCHLIQMKWISMKNSNIEGIFKTLPDPVDQITAHAQYRVLYAVFPILFNTPLFSFKNILKNLNAPFCILHSFYIRLYSLK